MFKRDYINTFSRRLLVFTLAIYLLNTLMGGKLFMLFSLQPSVIVEKTEFWRIFAFPFTTRSFEGIILFAITFFFFTSRLEEIFNKALYPIVLFLVACLQGTIFTILFWKSTHQFAGMEGISFFILTLFALLHANKKIPFYAFRPINSIIFVFFISAGWLISLAVHSFFIRGDKITLLMGIYSAVFGISVGFISYLQLRLTRLFRNKISDIPKLDIPKPEELSLALIHQNELRKFNQTLREELPNNEIEENLSEDRLNEILDKINERGKESLSYDEIKFLQDYSKNIS